MACVDISGEKVGECGGAGQDESAETGETETESASQLRPQSVTDSPPAITSYTSPDHRSVVRTQEDPSLLPALSAQCRENIIAKHLHPFHATHCLAKL